jgi:hypothetical protein
MRTASMLMLAFFLSACSPPPDSQSDTGISDSRIPTTPMAPSTPPDSQSNTGTSDSWIPITPMAPSTPNRESYPRNLSWSNIDLDGDGVGENYITPVRAQPCGDCYVYASWALVEARWQIDNRMADSLNLSVQNLHNCLKIPCSGAGDIWVAMNYIRDYGIMMEENSPTGNWLPGCDNCSGFVHSGIGMVPVESVPFYKVKRYDMLPFLENYQDRREALVKALQEGPVAIGINAVYGYHGYNGVLYCNDPNPVGSGHVVLVVGYVDHGTAFVVKNSWGEGKLITMVFAGGDKCGFASEMAVLPPGSVYADWGGGVSYCYSTQDFDGDGIPNAYDNCLWSQNPDQKDSNHNGWGDACDPCLNGDQGKSFPCP